ncbi:helix-turn-helix domain-containing protein [Streptococcus pluranimalium]|uniref:helix-turn-helix domain-containing protein n=1 Tax=Streptococcus pluranimalium TaxID=82348 RepID=UPI00313A0B0D
MDNNQRRQIWQMRSQGYGYGTIAKAIGLSRDSVKKYCKRNPELWGYGQVAQQMLQERVREGTHCLRCSQRLEIKPTGRPKKFCSDKCRKVWWEVHKDDHDKTRIAYHELTCQKCGRSFLAYANPNRKYCSHECYVDYRFYKGNKDESGS